MHLNGSFGEGEEELVDQLISEIKQLFPRPPLLYLFTSYGQCKPLNPKKPYFFTLQFLDILSSEPSALLFLHYVFIFGPFPAISLPFSSPADPIQHELFVPLSILLSQLDLNRCN